MGGRRRPECKRRTRFGSPRLFSFTLPAAWQAEHKLHYTFLQPEWGGRRENAAGVLPGERDSGDHRVAAEAAGVLNP